MQTFDTMPYGYRWLTDDEVAEYNATPARRRCGWMREEYLGTLDGRGIVQWDCMINFGLDHEHDSEECERTMFLMDSASDYTDWATSNYSREAEEDMLGRPLFPNEY